MTSYPFILDEEREFVFGRIERLENLVIKMGT